MFISAIQLTNEQVMQFKLFDRPSIKNFLHTLFPLMTERKFIFKLKPSTYGDMLTILVVSHDDPMPPAGITIVTKKMPASTTASNHYLFHVDTISTKQYKNTRQQMNLYREEDIRAWFVEKAPRYGFEVLPDQIEIRDVKKITIDNRGKNWKLPKATISGYLKVTNPSRFAETIYDGFGESRCFGFGLIELKHV